MRTVVDVVVNRNAGRADLEKLKGRISRALFRCELVFHAPASIGQMRALVRERVDAGTDGIVICGGDYRVRRGAAAGSGNTGLLPGLPDGAVWACLGETALLALAERYEAFSLGRDLDWRRVKEIDRLAREHGVDLAAIRGHAGAVTDREIALTRELAMKRMGEQR